MSKACEASETRLVISWYRYEAASGEGRHLRHDYDLGSAYNKLNEDGL